MTKASVNLKPSYEAKPLAGKLAELAILAFTPIFAVLGILLLVRGLSASTPLASIEIITGSVVLGGMHAIKMPSEKFETLQIFNKQFINIGKRILNRLAEGIETQQLEGKK